MKMKKGKGKQRMRRLSALLLSLILICAMSMTAFATQGDGVSGDGSGNGQTAATPAHSYTAYQIFTGDLFKGKLSNIGWGVSAQTEDIQGVIAKAVLGDDASGDPDKDLPKILDALNGAENDSDVANKLAAEIASNAGMLKNGVEVQNNSKVDPGYYILIDETANIKDGDSRGLALLQCPDGTIKINEKRGTVTSDKQVKDVNDSDNFVNGPEGEWGEFADYDINDNVEFVLTGTVADKFDMFDKYEFIFHDTESNGLTFQGVTKVTIDKQEIKSGYKVDTEPGDGHTFDVIFNFDDLKGIVGPGSEIKIYYTSKLNEKAAIGSAGNENKMYLTYSNDPYTGDLGKTPDKSVFVFTYKVDINKTDGDGKELPGAGFALYKVDNSSANQWSDKDAKDEKNYKLVAEYKSTKESPMTSFSFEGIDDGEYVLVETQTPDGYNSIEPVRFTVTANHGLGEDGVKSIEVNGQTISDGVKLEFSHSKISENSDTGTLSTDVVNKSGSLLPSTGGIGTTMFYIIGGILMVGACMMLFVRKIMTNEKR